MPAEVVAALIADISRQLPVAADGWTPAVQGVVGHVLGLRGHDGSGYVLKTYPRDGEMRMRTEVLALGYLRDGIGVAPDVVLTGTLPSPRPLPYVVLTRLPGMRWGDRRAELSPEQNADLIRAVGYLLHRLHVVPGERFGNLLPHGASWSSAWKRIDDRCDASVNEYLTAGGPAHIARQVRRLVDQERPAIETCSRPVLCHNDFNGGNLLVAASGAPDICGVVDLEKASWDDPLWDLALTAQHVRYYDPAAVSTLVDGYGLDGEAARQRLDVYEVLRALEARTWITSDRPHAWERSVAALDDFLMQHSLRP
jgi:hygromycin-B 7''-O-kinase